MLVLPEPLASHLGVSSGSGEVNGVVFGRANVTGNGRPSSGRQLKRDGSGWWVCQSCQKQPREPKHERHHQQHGENTSAPPSTTVSSLTLPDRLIRTSVATCDEELTL